MADIGYLVKFGDYVYADEEAAAEYDEEVAHRMMLTPSVGMAGAYEQPSVMDPRRIVVRGTISDETGTLEYRNKVRRLRRAHREGVVRKLYLQEDTFLYASVERIGGLKEQSPLTYSEWEASFVAADPYYYHDPQTVVALAGGSGGTAVNVVVPNEAVQPDVDDMPLSAPTLSAVVNSPTPGCTVTIANTTLGLSFVVHDPVAGILSVDSREELVYSGGNLLDGWAGQWPMLQIGANNITIVAAGCAFTGVPSIYFNTRDY